MFPLFPNLLPELRRAIWLHALQAFPELYTALRETNHEARDVCDSFLEVEKVWLNQYEIRAQFTQMRVGRLQHGPFLRFKFATYAESSVSDYVFAHVVLNYYRFGVKHGEVKEHHLNTGTLVKWGQFENGMKTGPWRTYACNGWLRHEVMWGNNMFHGTSTLLFPNGSVSEKSNWIADKRHGLMETWWQNGNLKRSQEWSHGRRHGWKKLFHSDGSLRLAIKYEHNVPQLEDLDGDEQELNEEDSEESDTDEGHEHLDNLEDVELEDEWLSY